MSKTIMSSYDKKDQKLVVTLYSNGLTKDGERVCKISRNTVTVENMIASILEENRGMDPVAFQHAVIMLQEQILKQLKMGNSVNILDLGLLYISVKGTAKGDNPNKITIPERIPRFTPSTLLNDSIKSLQIDKVIIADSTPHMDSIINTRTKQENILFPGKICLITGDRLKLGGDVYSLCFIPVDENGNESTSLPPVAVEDDMISRNTNSILEFYVPETLDPSVKYLIRFSSSFLTKTQSRKTPVVMDSNIITIEA